MSIEERIRAAITPIVTVCMPIQYTGEEPEYCTFNYEETGGIFGDNTADTVLFSAQLHYFLPWGKNPNAKKKELKKAIIDADFTYPIITNASDEEYQHLIFEFQDGGEP